MLFSSIPFLYYFLPTVMLVYFIVPNKFKNTVLMLSSLVFYAWGEPAFVLVMIATIVVGYVLGLLTEKYEKYKKIFVTLAVSICLLSLGFFKYTDFMIGNINQITGMSIPLLRIALPIGISFYTFQILSYNVDVYRGTVKAQRNIVDLAAYISMFPQLIAGPIVRYSGIEKRLKNRNHTLDMVSIGIRRFILGLSKKILIANALGELCEIFRLSNDKSVMFYWIYAISFTLHIYFDFSGYSDMAIGLGKIFGFDFMENFNYPYISKSVTEFWRRWHISLGTWFRDYVYIPMGGSRVKKSRMFFNIFVVWMLTGFWHGAAWNFVVWGLYYALLLIIEKIFYLDKLEKMRVINRIYVLLSVVIGFVIFNGVSLSQAFSDIAGMFGAGNIPLVSAEALYYLRSYGLILFFAVVGSTPIPKRLVSGLIESKIDEPRKKEPEINEEQINKLKINNFKRILLQISESLVLLTLMIIITAYLVDGSFNPFLYFRF